MVMRNVDEKYKKKRKLYDLIQSFTVQHKSAFDRKIFLIYIMIQNLLN